MRRWAVCLFVPGSMLLSPAAWPQNNQCCPQRREISVVGTGDVTAEADLAIVHVGYKLYGKDAKAVYASALDTSNAIMTALTDSGVPKSAIESTSQILQPTQPYDLNMYPVYSTERQNRQFTATQSWTIRVKPDDASKTLNTAINAGANESGWIQWIVQNPGDLEAEASSNAISNARTIAEQIAKKSGVHLGQLMTVSENQGANAFNGLMGGIAGGGMGGAGGAYDMVTVANRQLAINSRRVEFGISVFATFSIE